MDARRTLLRSLHYGEGKLTILENRASVSLQADTRLLFGYQQADARSAHASKQSGFPESMNPYPKNRPEVARYPQNYPQFTTSVSILKQTGPKSKAISHGCDH
jgi:hypothetical protein